MKIDKDIINKIFEHGQKDTPLEACGYLAGKDDTITEIYPMTNEDQSEEHFTLNPKEQFKVIKEIRQAELQLLSVYHTHPASPARPSEEDIKLAYDQSIIYIIASLLGEKDIKAFRIIKGEVQNIELEII
jgi:proteasome lid subunit RPN8/RPN11